eukprot:TRINITY_DN7709_c0_g1_i1.p1 TRINITY_DN7709_c0_g1~~TRINITY_DN7709_c0_g1_i1.p1  ORF type:complete len:135 (+),score=15.53 TRINITY_DN7709_c0_g1_i1:594-998(+)
MSKLVVLIFKCQNRRKARRTKRTRKKTEKSKPKVIRKTHRELENEGVVIRTDPLIRKDVLNKCHYEFSMMEPGVFKVEPIYKKIVGTKVLKEPLIIHLDDLLETASSGINVLDLDHVGLSVNLLIHLFNYKFCR